MARAIYLPEARDDLLEIWGYVFKESGSESIADGVVDAIDDAVETLATQPTMGELRPDLAPDIRCLSVNRTYVVFYLPCDEGIEVLQVIHGARDIPAHFRQRR